MIEIGAFDAKDKFSRLLDRVQLGEEVVITRRGKPVAKLVPNRPAGEVMEQLQEQIEEYPTITGNTH